MCAVRDGSSDSAESRFHELLTIAELEIDFLMLAAVSYIRAKHFLFPSVMYRMF